MVDEAQRPVSKALEKEVGSELRRRGVRIWLDPKEEFTEFVDRLKRDYEGGRFSYPVTAYRGSFLELLMQLEGEFDGIGNRPLLIHMPGFNEDTIRETPVFEHYQAGKRYQKALTTLVENTAAGKVDPKATANFVDGSDLTLDAADDWLRVEMQKTSGILSSLSLFEFWCRLEEQRVEDLPTLQEVKDALVARMGVDDEWLEFTGIAPNATADGSSGADKARQLGQLADALAMRGMAVEYVEDLRRDPYIKDLQKLTELATPLKEACHDFAQQLRQLQPDTYERLADEFEARISEEKERAKPEDLGHIDTFRFEEEKFLDGALSALADERWEDAVDWASRRNPSESFWLKQDPRRGRCWELVRHAAKLGRELDAHDGLLGGALSLEEAISRYASDLWEVDWAHRQMEQRRAALLNPDLSRFAEIRTTLDDMRRRFRSWSDALSREFNELCESNGFVPTESRQQRHLFEQVVEPSTRHHEQTVLFMVDALRFEMAKQLERALVGEVGTKVTVEPRLAELPSITAVGMNALAPVNTGSRLQPTLTSKGKFGGFKTTEFTVRDPESRRRMMNFRVKGRTCPGLDIHEIISGAKDPRKVAQESRLLVVHSDAIDSVGEKGYGQITFEATLRDIRSAIGILRKHDFKRFVITSDHGFLLLDETTHRSHEYGKKTEPSERYVVASHPEENDDFLSVSLASLNYDDVDGHLLLPRDTSVFDTGGSPKNFVHGGNSPQERVIPVLELDYSGSAGGNTERYELAARVEEHADGDELLVSVKSTQGSLSFTGENDIELSIRAVDAPDVSVEIIDIEEGELQQGAVFLAPVDKTVSVRVQLTAETDKKARLQVFSPGRSDKIEPATLDRWFDVRGLGALEEDDEDEGQTLDEESEVEQDDSADEEHPWADALEDPGVRRLFIHIAKFNSITEPEAMNFLGSARALRRFARNFPDLLKKVPFNVRIEPTPTGKKYVKTH